MDTRQPCDRQRQHWVTLHEEQTHVAAQGSAVTSHQVLLPGWSPWNKVWTENIYLNSFLFKLILVTF